MLRLFLLSLAFAIVPALRTQGPSIDLSPTVNLLVSALNPSQFPHGTIFEDRQAQLKALLLNYKDTLESIDLSRQNLESVASVKALGRMHRISQHWKSHIFLPWVKASQLDQKAFGNQVRRLWRLQLLNVYVSRIKITFRH